MRSLEIFIRRFAELLALLAGVSLLLMLLQTVGDVVMSRLFHRPIEGNMEVISVYHMVLVVFLPLAIVELRHEHINADLFVRMMPGKVQRAVYVFGCLVSLGFFGLLCFQTWLDAVEAWQIDEVVMGSIYIPVWPAKFALPVGFAAMLLAITLHILKAIFDRSFEPVPADPTLDESKLPVI